MFIIGRGEYVHIEPTSEGYFNNQVNYAKNRISEFIGLDKLTNIELVELNQLVRQCIEENEKTNDPRVKFDPGNEAAVRFCTENYGYNPNDPEQLRLVSEIRREGLIGDDEEAIEEDEELAKNNKKIRGRRDISDYFRKIQDQNHKL